MGLVYRIMSQLVKKALLLRRQVVLVQDDAVPLNWILSHLRWGVVSGNYRHSMAAFLDFHLACQSKGVRSADV